MTEAQTASRYADLAPMASPTGSDAHRAMSTLYARLVARYRLSAPPGRQEELTQARTGKTISLGYGCKTIRIRKHGGPTGRTWVDYLDIPIGVGWLGDVYAYLDQFMGFASPETMTKRAPFPYNDTAITITTE